MVKLIIAFLLSLLLASPAFAALRGTTSSVGTASATSNSLTYSGTAIVTGDCEILVTQLTSGSAETFTDPSGWTAGASIPTNALPDVNINSGSDYMHVAVKIAGSGDAGTPTYTSSATATGYWKQQLLVFSGRSNGSVGACFSNNKVTANGVAGNTPYSYTLTGLTASAGDDVVVIVGAALPNGDSGATTFGMTATGFSNLLSSYYLTYMYTGVLQSLSEVGVAGGSVAPVASITSNTAINVVPAGFIISMPASGGAAGRPYGLFLGLDVYQKPINLLAMAH